MKTPLEIFELMEEEMPFNILPNSRIKSYVLEAIELAQKDAYNQALEDAVNNVEWKLIPYTNGEYEINNNSILKLKKQ